MKKLLLIGSMVLVLGLLIIGFTVPIFAHSPGDGEATSANGEAWEAMHEACENGDWEAMAEAAEEAHGEAFGYMGSHMGGGWGDSQYGSGGMMGRGMMGW